MAPDSHLQRQGNLLFDTEQMAEFLGVRKKAVDQLVYMDRIPLPMKLGLRTCRRLSVIELLEWVEAGCPRRTAWIAARKQSCRP
jgi:predicted DNA-binding transcriptional regulator AlpA